MAKRQARPMPIGYAQPYVRWGRRVALELQRPGLVCETRARVTNTRHPLLLQAWRKAYTPWNRAMGPLDPEVIGLGARGRFVTLCKPFGGAFDPCCGRCATYSATHSQKMRMPVAIASSAGSA